MSPDPDGRFQEHMEFRPSHWYPGLVELTTGSSENNLTVTAFTTADLAVLRDMISDLLEG